MQQQQPSTAARSAGAGGVSLEELEARCDILQRRVADRSGAGGAPAALGQQRSPPRPYYYANQPPSLSMQNQQQQQQQFSSQLPSNGQQLGGSSGGIAAGSSLPSPPLLSMPPPLTGLQTAAHVFLSPQDVAAAIGTLERDKQRLEEQLRTVATHLAAYKMLQGQQQGQEGALYGLSAPYDKMLQGQQQGVYPPPAATGAVSPSPMEQRSGYAPPMVQGVGGAALYGLSASAYGITTNTTSNTSNSGCRQQSPVRPSGGLVLGAPSSSAMGAAPRGSGGGMVLGLGSTSPVPGQALQDSYQTQQQQYGGAAVGGNVAAGFGAAAPSSSSSLQTDQIYEELRAIRRAREEREAARRQSLTSSGSSPLRR